jgi:hypothetical protein
MTIESHLILAEDAALNGSSHLQLIEPAHTKALAMHVEGVFDLEGEISGHQSSLTGVV